MKEGKVPLELLKEKTPDNLKIHNIKTSVKKTVLFCQDQYVMKKITPFTPLRERKLLTLYNTLSTRQHNTPTHSSQKSAKS